MLLKQMQSFLPFELFIVGLFLLLCWHAVRMKAYHRAEYLTAFLYALMFEELDIRLFKTYHYGDGYFLMLGQVPIVIALAWAVIIYTSMQISDCFDLSNLAKASLDALLAVLIDLSVDAIAIRRGYWQWNIPLHAGWFGVPAGNLYAWMFVVFFFSFLCRQVRRLYAKDHKWLVLDLFVPPLAYIGLLVSIVVIGTINAVLQLDETLKLLSVLVVMILFIMGFLRGRSRRRKPVVAPISPAIGAVRLSLHGFFILELIRSGLFRHASLLLLIAAGVLLIEYTIHRVIRP
jgi:uncharacterized membrane protein